MGNCVQKLPPLIETLYDEARSCTGAGAYTAAVMACRKILMNVAVEKAADVDNNFAYYVGYLNDNGYIPPDGRAWVDYIRTRGNEANHEIHLMIKDDAENIIFFVEHLLKFIYELSNRLPRVPDAE